MYKKRTFLVRGIPFLLLFIQAINSSSLNQASRQIWVVVHGTFGKYSSWQKPTGDFVCALKQRLGSHVAIYDFSWEANNTDKARARAGAELKKYIKMIACSGDIIHIVGHSHGGNVAILAARGLSSESSEFFIETLFTLGTPVCTTYYLPDMYRIKKIYNLFSYGDRIQPVMQIFKRVFPDHPRIYNIQVLCNGLCPSHMGMRYPLIARYLPDLERLTQGYENSLRIDFFDKKPPLVKSDTDREKELMIDKQFTEQILTCFTESRNGKKTRPTPHQKLSFKGWDL